MRVAGEGVDGDLWWASTDVTTVVGSGVIGKYFTANHYDFGYCYSWNYITQNGTNLNGIICPDGWRLPTNNEIVALCKASGFTGVHQSTSAGYVANYNGTGKNGRWFGPGVATGGSDASKYTYTTDTHIFLPLAGQPNNTNNAVSSVEVGIRGDIWSSTPNGSSHAYRLELHATYFYPQFTLTRTHACFIRCVADPL